MAKRKKEDPLLSVLDRLIDDDPGNDREAPLTHDQLLRAIRANVCRDLENLLNTRVRCDPIPEDLEELQESLVNYGIPDFTGASMAGHEDRVSLQATLERVIRTYETRLGNVRVTLLENKEEYERKLRFRIEAILFAETVREPVVFDSELEPARASISVQSR